MKNKLLTFFFLLVITSLCSGADNAAFLLKNGETREAIFIVMKNDTIYIEIPSFEGKTVKKTFHKSIFKRVTFSDGTLLDLKKSNYPLVLDHRNAAGLTDTYSDYSSADSIKEFKTYQQEIAINNLSANGIDEHEAITLTDILRTELGKTGKFQVMERGKMNEVLKEQGFQQSGAYDEASCIVEMGQLLGVPYIIVGNVGKVGATYSINVRMVDVASGKILKEVSELHRGNKDKLLSHVMPSVAKTIAGSDKKKRKKGRGFFIVAGSLLVAAGVAIPVAILKQKEDDEAQSLTEVEIIWDQQ